jgi:hypothetical protein
MMPTSGDATLRVFTTLGSEVFKTTLTNLHSGLNLYKFNPGKMASGVYLYQITATNQAGKASVTSNVAKMIFMK